MENPKAFLQSLFDVAVKAADPARNIASFLPEPPKGRLIIVGAGKGSAQIAAAFEDAWEKAGHGAVEGLVVTRYGFGVECRNVEIIEASHPVPDAAGLVASNRLLKTVSGLSEDDLVVAVISGGGSALLPAPPDGVSLADEIAMNEMLLASGAPISAMNSVRKQVSRIKGGRLAQRAYPAKVLSLIVSDIPGDNPAHVASGPTVPDRGTLSEARDIVARYNMQLPASIMEHLNRELSDAPDPDDPKLAQNQRHIIASARVSLQAAQACAREQGIPAVILSDSIEGETREIGRMHAAIAREVLTMDQPFEKPVLLLSGGETTVTLNGDGKGGPNSEFLLSLALEIDGFDNIYALSADTDGIDGSQDNAGAYADGRTIGRMREKGIDPAAMLANNDAWTAFDSIDELFVCGPTGTNVNDFRAILITGN
ncbi:MAG: glycerate kinase [Rhizobiaceae bacterium]|nr:glycerate kinase [Rhizobiaceae bacterium]